MEPAHFEVFDTTTELLALHAQNFHRAIAQEARIWYYVSLLKWRPAKTSAIILMDYKMKFQPILYRESSLGFYRKLGIIFHCTLVLFKSYFVDVAVADGMGTLVLYHIEINDNFKYFCAVLSVLDAFVASARLGLPTLSAFSLVTYNA